ncbi:MAG: threonine synthase [Bacteroidota bacterium]
MLFYSLNKISPSVNFREAAISGQAPDKGLYFPESIPVLPPDFFKQLKSKTKEQIAFEVIKPYIGNSIPEDVLHTICTETVNFDFPLKKINSTIYSLELFHGPTLAFKDVGARFMSRCLGYFSRDSDKEVTVLVATSGDTGSAVANGFLGVKGVNVVILYPSGKVSKIQELQLTTLGKNITALEVQGTFDDCQSMVKQAFSDQQLNARLTLTSANSINVARWLPQQFYYFYALQQWTEQHPPVISVPSGNFGNICAGLLAYFSGAPIKHFVAACNTNDIFSNYIANKAFTPKTAVATISNAMDVGNPSNFVRMLEMFENKHNQVKELISNSCVDDELTAKTILDVYEKYNYLLEPHGAVAYEGLQQYLVQHPEQKGILLETAHPIKFDDTVKKITGQHSIEMPDSVKYLLELQKKSSVIKPEFNELKNFLLANK